MKTWKEIRRNITSLTDEEKRDIKQKVINKAKAIIGKDCSLCGFCYTAWNFKLNKLTSWCQNTDKGSHLIVDFAQANACDYYNDNDWFGG